MNAPSVNHYKAILQPIVTQAMEIAISAHDLFSVVTETSHLGVESRNFEGLTYSLARLFSGEPDKAGVIMFRILALARLVDEGEVREWILRQDVDGSVVAQKSLFAAAAVQPLVVNDGGIAFDPVAFRLKVAELTQHGNKEYLTLVDIRS